MILLLLMFMNSSCGFYIYLRFGPKKIIMIKVSEEKYKQYEESLPPIVLLNSFGRKLALLAFACVALSALILSELLLAL